MPAEIQHRVRGQQFGQVQEQESSRPQRPQQQQQQKDEPGVPTSNGMKLMDGRSRAVGVAAWAVNVLSSVTLIMTNKAVMSTFGFTFGTSPQKLSVSFLPLIHVQQGCNVRLRIDVREWPQQRSSTFCHSLEFYTGTTLTGIQLFFALLFFLFCGE